MMMCKKIVQQYTEDTIDNVAYRVLLLTPNNLLL